MASALSLLHQGQTDHTETLGATYTVDYKQSGGAEELGLSCFVSSREFEDVDKRVIRNFTVFSSLALTLTPKMRDIITLEGVDYSVVRFELNHGRYIIFTEDDVKHTGRRYSK